MHKIKMLRGTPFAHRGIHDINTIENTIEAFEKALEKDYGIELDIRMSKDEEVIVFHDENLKKLHGVDKEISNTNYQELKQYNIPKLSEVLQLLQKKKGKVLIEVKKSTNREKFMELILKEIKKADIELAIISFDIKVVKWFKEKNYLVGQSINKKQWWWKNTLVENILLYIANPDFLVIEQTMLENIKIKRMRNKRKIVAWTTKTIQQYKNCENTSDNCIFEGFDPKLK